MFTRILVPTDFGPASAAALECARTLARTFGGSLHVMHVVDNAFLRPVVTDPRDRETAARNQLRDLLTAEDLDTLHAVVTVAQSDDAADEILTYARSADIDLIVMGTHGRTGMAHFMTGSVAEHVVRAASCPVLTVREARARGEAHVHAHSGSNRLQRVL
jgi:nucleotide-binding universal stress UspA family protein